MTTRVLVLGGTGMLGHKLVQVLAAEPALDVHATVRRAAPAAFRAERASYHEGIELDHGLTMLADVVRATSPEVIVNAVGAIKQRKDLMGQLEPAFFVNGTLPHLLPLINPNPRGRVVHFSTDCVFVGDRGRYRETDAPDAEDLYGRSKACGELAYGRHSTIRTSIIGFELAGHLGLVSWLFGHAHGARLGGYRRAIFSGLPTLTLSRTVRDLLLRKEPIAGLWHVASEPIDKHDLLSRLSAAFGMAYDVEPRDDVVIDRSLDDRRFRQHTGTARPGWDALVEELRADFLSMPYETFYPVLRASGAAGR